MVYVVNTFGYGSFGDDSYAETLQSNLAETWPNSSIVNHRVQSIPFAPDRPEAVVLGGGGMLYRHTYDGGSDSLKHLFRYPASAQIFGRPTLALGLGVQGKLRPQDLEPYVEVLDAMTLRTVRDSRSAEILRQAGVTRPILESADLSYNVRLPERSPREERRRPVLGVAASQPDKGVVYDESHGFEDRVLDALQGLHSEFDIHFYSFDRRSDGVIPSGWKGQHSFSAYDPTSPDAVARFISEIGDSDLFLTSRLHGVIFCARMGIPFVSMGAPGEKVDRESQALEHPFHLDYDAGVNAIAEAVRNLWADRAQRIQHLELAAVHRERLAFKTLEALHTCN